MKHKPVYPKSKPKIIFSEGERKELEDFFKSSRNLRAKLRCHGVLLRAKGYSLGEITDILGKSDATVKSWTRLFKERGIKGLIPKPQPGNHRRLTREQKDEIKTVVKNKRPDQLGLRTKSKTKPRFWSVPTLRNFVKEQYSVEYQSSRSYQRLFCYCGFSFHRPVGNDKRQDPKKVKKFEEELRQKLEQIQEDEKRGFAGVFWLPTKPSLNTSPA